MTIATYYCGRPAILFLLGVMLLAADKIAAAEPTSRQAYLGTYTRGDGSEGIYVARLDLASGVLADLKLAAKTDNPSFLELHPSGRFVYAVGEVSEFDGQRGTGGVVAFQRDAETGLLERLNAQPTQGAGPCHVFVDKTGRNVLAANYGGGSVVVLPIGDDGRLGEATAFVQHEGASVNPQRQKEPHAHSVNLDPANQFAFVADLGLDKVLIYRFDAKTGKLAANDPPFAAVEPGSGPRHFAFHPSGRFAYVINELASTVTAFTYDPEQGRLSTLQTISTLPADFEGTSYTAEVRVHPSGKYLYGSNRGHDSLAIFSIDEKSGRLTAIGHQSTGGKTPRNFNIDPSGQFVLAANQGSNSVVSFRVDQATGLLSEVGRIEVGAPVCIRFAPN